ncbi:Uncharacterized protein, DUF1810 family [Pilibacter termitis]|uniref:Uncharacterized protein, DUF1810 family n=1 Tax=Pilibacter termitis TaxID=263852 RepID=A0A1T4K1K9_9ENTE|nr:DUF1810 domain-containing protein [Pilibacter termitis]SJZ36301.1 Uncharacterized protein, DUF1810 family [Pilibacter termitis]
MVENIERFLIAQDDGEYEKALFEIQSGRKMSHWIWYIFPQLKILGASEVAKFYGIENKAEGLAYWDNPLLKKRLVEISTALLSLEYRNPKHILGYPDNKKVKSCMTLFEVIAPEERVFGEVLEKFYRGERDWVTLGELKRE